MVGVRAALPVRLARVVGECSDGRDGDERSNGRAGEAGLERGHGYSRSEGRSRFACGLAC